jgi:hypothetical protein
MAVPAGLAKLSSPTASRSAPDGSLIIMDRGQLAVGG